MGDYLSADAVNVQYRFGAEPSNVGGFPGTFWDVAGFGSVFQVCAELHDDDLLPASFTVTSGISAFGDIRDSQLTALFSNAYPLLDGAVTSYVATHGVLEHDPSLDDEWKQIVQYSVALQTLTWIIVENNDATISPTDTSTSFGILNNGLGDTTTINYVIDWASSINNGTWGPDEDVTLYYAFSSQSSIQDRVWAQIAVPEPASWMVITGAACAGTLFRRRR